MDILKSDSADEKENSICLLLIRTEYCTGVRGASACKINLSRSAPGYQSDSRDSHFSMTTPANSGNPNTEAVGTSLRGSSATSWARLVFTHSHDIPPFPLKFPSAEASAKTLENSGYGRELPRFRTGGGKRKIIN